jgi:hypothetical protein
MRTEEKTPLMSRSVLVLCLFSVGITIGCGSTAPPRPVDPVDLVQATTEVAEDQLLDVSISVFDPGLPEEDEELPDGVQPEVRKAEARYMAYRLEETMQETGHWGAVRVVPQDAARGDVVVSARILESSGRDLNLYVRAADATGRVWFENRYKGRADPAAYLPETIGRTQPFQNVYNRIANDLVRALGKLDPEKLVTVRRVAKLDYAAELAPMAFQDYLETDRKGRKSIVRLPAEDDPMMARVNEIREREYFFVDVLNQHYANFTDQMVAPYDNWRMFSYEEQVALAALRRKATTQQVLGGLAVLGSMLMGGGSTAERVVRDAAMIGGVAAITAGVGTRKEAKIHAQALQELSASFDTEVEPMVMEVDGRVLRLTGSVETQYETWRRLLSTIWADETGLPTDPNRAPGGSAPPN